MLKKGLVLFIFLFLNLFTLKSQINDEDICEIYSTVIYDLKQKIMKYHCQKDLYFFNTTIIVNDFVRYIEIVKTSFNDNLEKNNIDYTKFINKTNNKEINCTFNNITLINGGDFYSHLKKYSKKRIGMCVCSNIAFYDDYAFFYARITLSNLRTYTNFYFLKKDKNWGIIYSSLEND